MSEDDGLREALAAFLRGWISGTDADVTALSDGVLTLPEVADLRAKAAAADRVREAIDRHADNLSPTQRAAFARALDGPSPC